MSTRALAAVTALVAAVGLVLSGLALWDWQRTSASLDSSDSAVVAPAQSATQSPAQSPAPAPSAPTASPGRDAPPEPPRPARLTVAGVDLDMPVRPVGVAPDGQMALPADPTVLGWYRFGPAPGARSGGSVVLAGHLDTVRDGLGPLVRLREVSPGDRVEVTDVEGRVRPHEVVAVDRYDRQALPAELFRRSGPERIRIITCGGAYVPGQGYEQNLVVTARPL